MKASRLEYKKEYRHIGKPDVQMIFTGQQGKRYYFSYKNAEVWMTEKQVEDLITEIQ